MVSPQRLHHFLRLALPLGLLGGDYDYDAAGGSYYDPVAGASLSAISARLVVRPELFRVSNRVPCLAHLPLVTIDMGWCACIAVL